MTKNRRKNRFFWQALGIIDAWSRSRSRSRTFFDRGPGQFWSRSRSRRIPIPGRSLIPEKHRDRDQSWKNFKFRKKNINFWLLTGNGRYVSYRPIRIGQGRIVSECIGCTMVKVAGLGSNVTSVPVRPSEGPSRLSGLTATPSSNRMEWALPSRQILSSRWDDKAFTTDTPTPWRPPETL